MEARLDNAVIARLPTPARCTINCPFPTKVVLPLYDTTVPDTRSETCARGDTAVPLQRYSGTAFSDSRLLTTVSASVFITYQEANLCAVTDNQLHGK